MAENGLVLVLENSNMEWPVRGPQPTLRDTDSCGSLMILTQHPGACGWGEPGPFSTPPHGVQGPVALPPPTPISTGERAWLAGWRHHTGAGPHRPHGLGDQQTPPLPPPARTPRPVPGGIMRPRRN